MTAATMTIDLCLIYVLIYKDFLRAKKGQKNAAEHTQYIVNLIPGIVFATVFPWEDEE